MTCNHLSQDFSRGFLQGQALQSSAKRTWSCFIWVAKDRSPQKMKELGDAWPTVFSQHPTVLFLVISLSCGQISMFSCPVSTFPLEYEVHGARHRFALFTST